MEVHLQCILTTSSQRALCDCHSRLSTIPDASRHPRTENRRPTDASRRSGSSLLCAPFLFCDTTATSFETSILNFECYNGGKVRDDLFFIFVLWSASAWFAIFIPIFFSMVLWTCNNGKIDKNIYQVYFRLLKLNIRRTKNVLRYKIMKMTFI